MIIAGTDWEKWPEREKRYLEKKALTVPCDWCKVDIGRDCKDRGSPFYSQARFNAYPDSRVVCCMRILRGWFNVPDEERETMAMYAKLYAAT